MEVNCWTWMWSCMAQHHSTLNRAVAQAAVTLLLLFPTATINSVVSALVPRVQQNGLMRRSATQMYPWKDSQQLSCIESLHGLGIGCIRITHALHFAANLDEMMGERHSWQLWTCEPCLTSGHGWAGLCVDASQPVVTTRWSHEETFVHLTLAYKLKLRI